MPRNTDERWQLEQDVMVGKATVNNTPEKTGQDKEELMRLAFEASPNGMLMVDSNGNIVFANSGVESMFGYRRHELIGQPVEILVPTRFRDQHPGHRGAYLKAPQARAMGSGRELYAVHKSGREIPVEIGLNPINDNGQTLILAVIVDITERYRAQEMMRLAVEAAPNGMIMSDADGRITMVNTLAESMFGYSREELIGQEITILIPHRFRAHHPQLREAYYQQPESRAMGKGRDLYALHKNGDEFPVEIGLNPIETAQGVMILASVVDITERKQQEEKLMSALREKEVLLSEIHHRVKNNLQIIDSLIGMQTLQITQEKPLAILLDSQNRIRAMSIIHQMLYQSQDFSRLDITSAVSSLVNNLAATFGMDNHHFDIALDVDDFYLPIDISVHLGLIINEMVSNAMKHAFPDGREGTISVHLKTSPSDDEATLTVEDNGIGLPDHLDMETTDSLGLRLITALADQLDGELTIRKKNPTRFSLTFPTKAADVQE